MLLSASGSASVRVSFGAILASSSSSLRLCFFVTCREFLLCCRTFFEHAPCVFTLLQRTSISVSLFCPSHDGSLTSSQIFMRVFTRQVSVHELHFRYFSLKHFETTRCREALSTFKLLCTLSDFFSSCRVLYRVRDFEYF